MKIQRVKQVKKTKYNTYDSKPQDWYEVNGVKYLRADLVNENMNNIMERIAVALESQIEYYKKWEVKADWIMETMKKAAERDGLN